MIQVKGLQEVVFSLKSNTYIIMTLLLIHFLIGFGVFSDPRSSDYEGQTLSSAFLFQFFIYLCFVTIGFYLVITRYRKHGLKILYSTVFTLILVMFCTEFAAHISKQKIGWMELFTIFLAIGLILYLIAVLAVYISGNLYLTIRNYGLLTLSALTARIVTFSVDLETFIILASIISIYDIWNVFHGPLTKLCGVPRKIDPWFQQGKISVDMIRAICKQGTPVIIDLNQGSMTGIGDYLFYSAMMFTGFLYWGSIGLFTSFILINLGIFSTHYLLKFLSPLPGLPLPVSYCLLGFFVLNLIQ